MNILTFSARNVHVEFFLFIFLRRNETVNSSHPCTLICASFPGTVQCGHSFDFVATVVYISGDEEHNMIKSMPSKPPYALISSPRPCSVC